MPVATHTIRENSPIAERMSRALSAAESEQVLKSPEFVDFGADPNFSRPPDYYLYIYNISERGFVVHRPPTMPHITIAARKAGEAYATVMRIPNIFNEKYVEAFTGRINITGIRGEQLASNLLNPANLTDDCWANASNWSDTGNDLTVRGCFWSRNNPPTEAELQKARARMETYYRTLVTQANEHQAANRFGEIGPEHHVAAEYFRLQLPWHRRYEAPASCPVCGEEITAGVAFHKNSLGAACVLDWQRTVEAGVKTLADVPVEKRWSGPKWPRESAEVR